VSLSGTDTPDTLCPRLVPGEAKQATLLSTPWRKAVSGLAPDGFRIELENRAHDGEREAVLSLRDHPVPGFELVATVGPETPEGILEDGLAETPQPVIYRRVVIVYGLEVGSGKPPEIDRHTRPPLSVRGQAGKKLD